MHGLSQSLLHSGDAVPATWHHLSFLNSNDDANVGVESTTPLVSLQDADTSGLSDAAMENGSTANPAVWGPKAWEFLHCVARHLPDRLSPEAQQNVDQFMNSLAHLLPCRSCSLNMQRHLLEDPLKPHLDTREHIERWLINLHNKVNAETGKHVLSDAEAAEATSGACARLQEQPWAASGAVAKQASALPMVSLATCGKATWWLAAPCQLQRGRRCVAAERCRWSHADLASFLSASGCSA
mmetsp:Transcript_9359/g.16929  ORF Transcript_9359/g.16929 Transcript_9359/m.16929 type:complete len:240 (+) Transcript_9359:20-739(+)